MVRTQTHAKLSSEEQFLRIVLRCGMPAALIWLQFRFRYLRSEPDKVKASFSRSESLRPVLRNIRDFMAEFPFTSSLTSSTWEKQLTINIYLYNYSLTSMIKLFNLSSKTATTLKD